MQKSINTTMYKTCRGDWISSVCHINSIFWTQHSLYVKTTYMYMYIHSVLTVFINSEITINRTVNLAKLMVIQYHKIIMFKTESSKQSHSKITLVVNV